MRGYGEPAADGAPANWYVERVQEAYAAGCAAPPHPTPAAWRLRAVAPEAFAGRAARGRLGAPFLAVAPPPRAVVPLGRHGWARRHPVAPGCASPRSLRRRRLIGAAAAHPVPTAQQEQASRESRDTRGRGPADHVTGTRGGEITAGGGR